MNKKRIYVIGPSGSGKTYLAKVISKHFDIPHTNLDYVFFDHKVSKSREEVSDEEWRRRLNKLIKEDSWIIEGVNPINEVFELSDQIIFLRLNIIQTLMSQWKRYLTDEVQRREHGFINNLKLSKYLIKQHVGEEKLSKSNDPKYFRIRKVDRILKSYSDKSIVLKSRSEVNKFIKTL
jgi:adenylate kinase family enzyme